jgi:hypothetical protein
MHDYDDHAVPVPFFLSAVFRQVRDVHAAFPLPRLMIRPRTITE